MNEDQDDTQSWTKAVEDHPVEAAINKLIHHILDVQSAIRTLIPTTAKLTKSNIEKAIEDFEEGREKSNDTDKQKSLEGTKQLYNAFNKLDRLKASDPIGVLSKGLYLSLFSVLDTFVGELIEAIYVKNPDMYSSLSGEMSIKEMLQYGNIDDIKGIILQSEIERIRRQSYIDQFKELEKRHDINLRKFDLWPGFVEHSQRRNLFTHCDGIVSEQYIRQCEKEGYRFEEKPASGDRLTLGPKYLFESCRTVMMVGLMLGQTLWRKVVPEELAEADSHITSTIYDFLQRDDFKMAVSIGEYFHNLPKRSSDLNHRIGVVNYAIGLKRLGKNDNAEKALSSLDWSAASLDFKLANFVLREDYKEASSIMLKIGKKGDLIEEESYHLWPLFYDYRNTEEFQSTYQEIFGYPFAEKFVENAEEKSGEIKGSSEQQNVIEGNFTKSDHEPSDE
jgi:hypothetical protein